ncbi:Symplekin tight junction protein C terminal-domain-containing protein [Tribonema minus]|uniref:Symplekin tight junction protein C terminal-domain-containing protein n=1 Tax=Tribonema minus TaxID=303371 RepID=A0A835YPU9_9STRA|nr:Symplekin tight junction protein C terminal-domain-containing protein [Tribonema minus]
MEAELQALITAAAAKMGAPDVLALLSSAPAGGGAKPEKGERRGDRGVEFVVPVLGGLAAEERDALLPQVLRALRPVVDAAFHRLTSPRAAPPVTPVGLLVTLHNFNIAATGVPMKKLTDAVGYCLENKAVFSSHVMREALDTMSKAAAEPGADGKGKRGLPLLFMRTVILAVQGYPELKQYIAVTLLPRLVQQEVWTQPRAWDGFVRIAKIMGTETGATSFIALMLLPAPQLREVLKTHKGIKELLKSYAAGVIKVDPAVKEVLGM